VRRELWPLADFNYDNIDGRLMLVGLVVLEIRRLLAYGGIQRFFIIIIIINNLQTPCRASTSCHFNYDKYDNCFTHQDLVVLDTLNGRTCCV
jgi:hypothetical protein